MSNDDRMLDEEATPGRGPSRARFAPIPRAECPLAAAAELFGQRWTLLILRELFYGVHRFDDIRADLDVSRSTLTIRLRELVDRGIVAVEPYREARQRPRNRYVLTDAGADLTTTFWAITEWSERHLHGRPAPARLTERATGGPVSARLTSDHGDTLSDTEVRWEIRSPDA